MSNQSLQILRLLSQQILLLCSLLMLAACTSSTKSFSVENQGRDISTNVGTLKTYAWDFDALRDKLPTGGHLPEFNRVLCEHVDKHLAELGYQRVDGEHSDFVLDYRVVFEKGEAADDLSPAMESLSHVEEVNDYSLRWRFDKRTNPEVEEPKDHMAVYQRGILHIAAVDNSQRVMWHYSVSKILNQRANEAERRAALRIAIDKVMKEFPTRY